MFCCCSRRDSSTVLSTVPSTAPESKSDTTSPNGKMKISESEYTFTTSDQTLIKGPNSLPIGYPIFILDSKNSQFFILDSSVQATLECLENCKIILGPTESSLFIRDCKNCLVIAYCQQFRARDCFNLNVFLYSSTDPIIETCKNIKFHPNTLKYDALDSQLKVTGLHDKPNKWDCIYDFNDSWPKNYSISNESCVLDTSIISNFNISF